jgi:hypothetical protein
VKFDSDMYNINKGNKVVFPYQDKKNSFDFLKVMDEINNTIQNNIIENK